MGYGWPFIDENVQRNQKPVLISPLPEVEIVEVLRRSEHGMTKPFICRGDDDHIYFVKGTGAGRESQIKEWIAGNLALEFGIPLAPFGIVSVSEEITELLAPNSASDLGAGPAFGSQEQIVTELSYSQVKDVPVQLRKAVLVFDWWIANVDRMLTENSGNPNLFWDAEEQRLVVIDHNQSFDPDFDADDFCKYHAFGDCVPVVFDDLVERQHYTDRMEQALLGWDGIVQSIPEEWWYRDPEMTMELNLAPDHLLKHLQRFRRANFWNWK
ncbi:HipA family kinase [Marinobacter sp. CHS3-4]|uniref:HipA family kinase n=1 Tax=Marinobacter sp. CHS3-4 TaxID=3045174 RepID=UPI0024B4FE16|nr:HipA family kinase [Marinobacter sp. CHS3-4]MDI9244539.1 hypothetical protein [Marinobacter sp. CHS3-4]